MSPFQIPLWIDLAIEIDQIGVSPCLELADHQTHSNRVITGTTIRNRFWKPAVSSGDAAAERPDVSKIVNSGVKITVFLVKQCVFCGI